MDDVDYEKKEEAGIGFDNEDTKNIKKIILYVSLIVLAFGLIFGAPILYIFNGFSIFTQIISMSDHNTLFQETINSRQINLTSEEYEKFNRSLLIVNKVLLSKYRSNEFTPLFEKASQTSKPNDYVPLNKISFMISSSPKTAYLCKLYLDIWSTKYGSNIVKSTGIQPLKEVYWSLSDLTDKKYSNETEFNSTRYIETNSYNISLINQTSHHKKWFFMIRENFKIVPDEIEWFIILDDDTLPFLDRILTTLTKYENPKDNSYFIHSPGERISGTHLGNGGSGFIMSRKLATMIIPELDDCNKHIRRRFYNGDIRLDHCTRYKTGTMPILDYGMFQMDKKGLSGDLTGFIENYADRYVLKCLHHLEKTDFFLFPKKFCEMMSQNSLFNVRYSKKYKKNIKLDLDFDTFADPNYFSQAAHFSLSLAISDNLFLNRFIIILNGKKQKFCGILNLGYSFVVFSSPIDKKKNLKNELFEYLKGVENTFTSNNDVLYNNLTRLIIPKNNNLKRFYIKKIEYDPNGKNSYWQEFCSISSPETVVKIHVDDNQKVSLSFFNFSYI